MIRPCSYCFFLGGDILPSPSISADAEPTAMTTTYEWYKFFFAAAPGSLSTSVAATSSTSTNTIPSRRAHVEKKLCSDCQRCY